jgi:misacylated tRNA(Ala) deacylase
MKEIYPPMHTAEHLLNQTMVRLFGTKRCFSAHIEAKKSKCDYHFDRDLTSEEVKNLEDKVNEVIKLDLPVIEQFIIREFASKEYDLTRLPENEDENIRIIKIGDYDVCPCIGPHVKSTKEIGEFKIISHDFNDGILRIRYKLIHN